MSEPPKLGNIARHLELLSHEIQRHAKRRDSDQSEDAESVGAAIKRLRDELRKQLIHKLLDQKRVKEQLYTKERSFVVIVLLDNVPLLGAIGMTSAPLNDDDEYLTLSIEIIQGTALEITIADLSKDGYRRTSHA